MTYYFCDVCHYCFEAESLPDRCPDCGKTKYKDHPAVAMLNVVTDDGMVDIDKVYTVAKPMFDQRQSIDLPLIGRVTFDGGDVEKLYRYISEA